MGKSRREPYAVDGYGSKWKKTAKRVANRRVKANDDLASGNSYKKVSNSWDICDYKFRLEDTKKNRSK